MKQATVDFDLDEEGDWRAILDGGHTQHVRHNPPLTNRPWLQPAAGRRRFLGFRWTASGATKKTRG